jgi:hypothetical protein
MWTKVNKVSTWLVKQLEKRISIIRMWFTCKQNIFLLIDIIFLQILQCCRIPWYISVPCSICSNNLCAEIQNHTYFPLLKIVHYWNISFKTKVGIERTIIAKLPVNTINHVLHIVSHTNSDDLHFIFSLLELTDFKTMISSNSQ